MLGRLSIDDYHEMHFIKFFLLVYIYFNEILSKIIKVKIQFYIKFNYTEINFKQAIVCRLRKTLIYDLLFNISHDRFHAMMCRAIERYSRPKEQLVRCVSKPRDVRHAPLASHGNSTRLSMETFAKSLV